MASSSPVNTASSSRHWSLCLLLTATSQLLECGVDELLAEGMTRVAHPPVGSSTGDKNVLPNIFNDFATVESAESERYTTLVRLALVVLVAHKKQLQEVLHRLRSTCADPSAANKNGLNLREEICQFCSYTTAVQSIKSPLTATGVPIAFATNASSKLQPSGWHYVDVSRTREKGRLVQSCQSLGPGITVCHDQPYLLSLASPCHCRYHHTRHEDHDKDVIMPLLVEHLALALCFYGHVTAQTHKNYAQEADSVGTDELPSRSSSVHDSHISAFFTLLDGHLTAEEGKEEDEEKRNDLSLQVLWSDEQLRIFAVLSALTVLILEDDTSLRDEGSETVNGADREVLSASSQRKLNDDLRDIRAGWQLTDNLYKTHMSQRALLLFRILTRLPTNTHAVSVLRAPEASTPLSSSSSVSTVQSQSIAYAVFLQASAVNHSCQANTTIRYSISPSTTLTTRASAKDLITKIRLEIVTTTNISSSISSNEEITSCYGPLYPRHTYAQRQHALYCQYLFHCRCVACVIEANNLARQKQLLYNQLSKYPEDLAHQRSMQRQALEQLLQRLQEDVLAVNVALTTLCTQQPPSPKQQQAHGEDTLTMVLSDNLQRLLHISSSATATTTSSLQIDRINNPFPKKENDLQTLDTALGQLWQVTTHLRQHVLQSGIVSPAFGNVIWQELLVLNCDDDDRATAERFRALSFRTNHYPLPPTNREEPEPLFAPHGSFWKESLSLWCCLLDLEAQILVTRPQWTPRSTETGHMVQAAKRVNFAVNLMIAGGLYEASDIVIARERVKMASLYLNAGDWEHSRRRVLLALPILQVHHHHHSSSGSSGSGSEQQDPDLQEALHIEALTNERDKAQQAHRKKSNKSSHLHRVVSVGSRNPMENSKNTK